MDFRKTGLFSKLIVDYVEENPKLNPFYAHPPTLKGYKKALEAKKISADYRNTLVKVLKEQYANIDTSKNVIKNIHELLNKKTFTVTTGHQLNIFTGPLFYIYKLITTINLAKKLKKAYPNYRFVPIYWMGSEDHDYEEINYVHINNKKYKWQTNQAGATGRFSTKGLEEVLKQLPGRTEIFKKALKKHTKLVDVVRDYINQMFGEEGLICIDADDARFKKEFLPVIKKELFEEHSHKLVTIQNKALDRAGYKQKLQPRALNLFYLDEDLRARIIKDKNGFSVLNTNIHFSNNEISKLLEHSPEKFSPNVILRPVFQETILPNIAYIGGPSELAYWFQLKLVFNSFKIPFPILTPRSFVMYISIATWHKIKKLNIDFTDLFLSKDLLINKYIKMHANDKITLSQAKEEMKIVFKKLRKKASFVDKTLGCLVDGELVNGLKLISRIEKKMLKAEKKKRVNELRMLCEIYESLYPSGMPHERIENILSINDPYFIKHLLKILNPLSLKYELIKANQ